MDTKKQTPKVKEKPKSSRKKKILSLCVLGVGVAALAAGVVFLVLNIMTANKTADGNFLVEASSWTLESSDNVVWNFTEIGKGTLTTNNHLNDYDFIWSIEDNKLLIETDWLYDLENEYTYELDQNSKTLNLTDANGGSYTFKAN